MKSKKGVVYVMTTPFSGVIKVGKTQSYEKRMGELERTGYRFQKCDPFFAIELDNYDEKEKLLKEILKRYQVDGELFAIEPELMEQLLLSFEGQVVYPKNIKKDKEFGEIAKIRKQGELFSFYKKGINEGDLISFIRDKNITAKVINEREVEYDNRIFKLSPLTRKIYEEKNKRNKSGAYQGASHWQYKGKKLKDLPDKKV